MNDEVEEFNVIRKGLFDKAGMPYDGLEYVAPRTLLKGRNKMIWLWFNKQDWLIKIGEVILAVWRRQDEKGKYDE